MSKKTIYYCEDCGSENVLIDAYVAMNDDSDVRKFDQKICDDCGAENHIGEREVDVDDGEVQS